MLLKIVIASEAKQSLSDVEKNTGLLRYARNDDFLANRLNK